MADDLPSLLETIELMDRYAGLYTVAELAGAAGISGAVGLKTSVIESMAEVTSRLGIDVLPAYPTESGFAAVAWRYSLAAGTWLRGAAASLLSWVSKNPGMVIAGTLVGGTVYSAYSWLTMAERTELGRMDQVGQVLQHAIDGMSPEDRAKAFAMLSAKLGAQPQRMSWVTIGLVVIGGWIAYRALADRK